MATIKMLPPAPEHAAFHGPYEDIPALSERISALVPEGLTFAEAILYDSPLSEDQRQELWRLNECIVVRSWYAQHEKGGHLHAGGIARPEPDCLDKVPRPEPKPLYKPMPSKEERDGVDDELRVAWEETLKQLQSPGLANHVKERVKQLPEVDRMDEANMERVRDAAPMGKKESAVADYVLDRERKHSNAVLGPVKRAPGCRINL